MTFSVCPILFTGEYETQRKSSFDMHNWETLPGTNVGNGGIVHATVTNAFTVPHQFYWIRQLP